jgi:hypothetical protein
MKITNLYVENHFDQDGTSTPIGGVTYAGKFTFAESAWTASSTSEQLNLGYTLATSEVVDTCFIVVNTAYSGPGAALSATIDIGVAGGGEFNNGDDAMSGSAKPPYHFDGGSSNAFLEFNSGATQAVTIKLTVDSGFVSQFDDGTFDVHLWTRKCD